MVRNFLVSVVVLFLVLGESFVSAISKKRINIEERITSEDLFIPNQQLEQLVVDKENQSKSSLKKSKRPAHNFEEVQGLLTDIPRCIDAYDTFVQQFSHEVRHEFCTKQSLESIQQFYLSELTRLGWNVELFSVLKESILFGEKPLKKVLIIVDIIKGGWFSTDCCKVIIILKEQ